MGLLHQIKIWVMTFIRMKIGVVSRLKVSLLGRQEAKRNRLILKVMGVAVLRII